MQMTAVDYDDPATPNAQVEYEIVRNKEINGVPVFRMDRHTGKIYAMMPLDRENPSERQFEISVRATDNGRPQLAGNIQILKTLN